MSRTYDFFWDGDDRLRTVKQGAISILTGSYDGSGRRTGKSDNWTGVHTYTWGVGGIVYDNDTGVTTTPGLSKRQSGVDRFFHSDWLGSTRYLSDNSGNNFPSALRYDAFGGRSLTGGSDPYDPTDYQFGGDWGYQTEYATATEPGVGLEYLQQRYYDPAVGRFISQDPIGLGDYSYAGNDPVNGVDPSGLLSLEDIRQFDYNNRFILGAISGVGATILTGNVVAGAAWGGYITYQNSLNGSGDPGMALADGFLVASGVYEATGFAGQASAAYQYRFGNFEEPGVSCGGAAPDAGPLPMASPSSAARLARDIAVNPVSPAALPTTRAIGPNGAQNTQLQADIARLQAEGAVDFRVNQHQVDVNGVRVGINRPDLQYSLYGARYHIEYDTDPANGLAHQQRILANDPASRVLLKTIR